MTTALLEGIATGYCSAFIMYGFAAIYRAFKITINERVDYDD